MQLRAETLVISLDARPFDREEWTGLCAGFRDLSLLQSWEYGEAKAQGGWRAERAVFRQAGRVVGLVQALVRPLPLGLGGVVWINRGPLWRPVSGDPAADPAELLAGLRAHWARGGFYLRLAPGTASQEPAGGLGATGRAGWASALLDLTPDEAVLRKSLAQKWRNCLNKAERQELAVTEAEDGPDFEGFLERHAGFVEHRGFVTSVTIDLIRRLQAVLPPERRLRVLLASHQGQPAAAVLVARYGDTAEYLAGHVLEAGRGVNAGHLLLWRAVTQARAAGCRAFDLGGMDELRTPPGIYHFKAGLGAVPYRLAEDLEACGPSPAARLVRWRVRRALADEATPS